MTFSRDTETYIPEREWYVDFVGRTNLREGAPGESCILRKRWLAFADFNGCGGE